VLAQWAAERSLRCPGGIYSRGNVLQSCLVVWARSSRRGRNAGPDLGGAGGPGPQAPHQQGASHQTPQFHYSLTGLPGDDVFDIYFHNMSSASGGFAPRPRPGLCPWTTLGDFRPPDLLVPPPSFISKFATAP